MIDFALLLRLLSMYCNSYRSFLLTLSACVALFTAFAIIKMIMRVKIYV